MSAPVDDTSQSTSASHLEIAKLSGPPYFDEVSRQIAIDIAKPSILQKRRSEHRCVMCGNPVGRFTRFFRDKHKHCNSFDLGGDYDLVDTNYDAYRLNGFWRCAYCSRYIIPSSGITRVWNIYDQQLELAHVNRYCPKCGTQTLYKLK